MSLRAQLIAGIIGLVGITVLLAGLIIGRVIVHPFVDEVFETHLDLAVYIADEIDAGRDPIALAEAFDVQIIEDDPPQSGGLRPRRWVESMVHRGRQIRVRGGPHGRTWVSSDDGTWVAVRHDIDIHRPARKLFWALLWIAAVVVAVAAGLAVRAAAPVLAAREAMTQLAAGDLSHRLDDTVSGELAGVARDFNAMADRIRSMLRTEKEMMAGISHELRTPLTRLRLELELLRDRGVAGDRIDAMNSDIGELDALVGELLSLSRLELGHTELASEQIDLRALADDVVAGVRTHAVTVVGAGNTTGDLALIRRALTNLVRNAAIHTPEGTPVTVYISDAMVQVADQGPGVPEEVLPRLFDPFYQTADVPGGTGLGLMIVRRVAELHGGSATAELGEQGGLVITITLGLM